MHFESLVASGFRNLDIALELAAEPVILAGHNAQGKTNILEALYLCATGRSFRYASPDELLQHDATAGRVTARFVHKGVRHDVDVILNPKKRTLKVDGRTLAHAGHLLELLNVVAFFPDDLKIIKGSPEERRRFLDRAVANMAPDFYEATLGYHRVLRARNQVLAGNPVDRAWVEVYDTQLVQFGAAIHQHRQAILKALTPHVQQLFGALMGSDLRHLDLSLVSGIGDHTEDFAAYFSHVLKSRFPYDCMRGMTTRGPHRADLKVTIEGKDARDFASQGQQRVVILAFKMAEVALLKGKLGMPPVLLLDDVSSELDSERTRRLFTEVERLGPQAWITTTGATPLPISRKTQRFHIISGRVGVENTAE
jgi:DNA replication and repair protein RecF